MVLRKNKVPALDRPIINYNTELYLRPEGCACAGYGLAGVGDAESTRALNNRCATQYNIDVP